MSIIPSLDNIFIGTDIIEVDRIKSSLCNNGKRFLDRVYTSKEQDYCNQFAYPYVHFAGRFAAKESIIKALKSSGYTNIVSLNQIEITPDSNGAPVVKMHFNHLGDCKVSISHIRKYATAFSIYTLS
jgi:holo-[acyl-carrier protein] synthase